MEAAMGKAILIICFVAGVILLITAGGAIGDAMNADYIAPMPTPFHNDVTSDILTIAEPEAITGEVREVAIVDEITDLARDVSDNQVRQDVSSNQALVAVSVAGYTTIGALEASHTFRDVIFILVLGGCFIGFVVLKLKSNERR
jgi:hypothetical protein